MLEHTTVNETPRNIRRRVVAHFPGFEPLDAEAHRQRYARAAAQSGEAFGFSAETGLLETDGPAPHFSVSARGPGWRTETSIHILGHFEMLERLNAAPLHLRLWRGWRAAFRVCAEGGFFRYMKVSWRFGLFFLGPFVLAALGFAAAGLTAFMPLMLGLNRWHLIWSVCLAVFVFGYGIVPWAERAHVLHMFADWELAVELARLKDPAVSALIESRTEALAAILRLPCDEILITAHSLGGTLAAHALGVVLERSAGESADRQITFVTLAGSGFQSSLLSSAAALRARIRKILTSGNVFWMDVQCLTDIVGFYNSRVARDNGHADLPEPAVVTIRIKHMLTPEHYRKIKRDFLRVHRQFVLGSDRRTYFDFTLLTAGPFRARSFADFSPSSLPPLDESGAVKAQEG